MKGHDHNSNDASSQRLHIVKGGHLSFQALGQLQQAHLHVNVKFGSRKALPSVAPQLRSCPS